MSNFKVEPHSMTERICGKSFCSKCGLVALNNGFSIWALRQGCSYVEHPSYNQQYKQAVKKPWENKDE